MHHQRTKPVDVAFHPLISEAYDLCRAIEKCGASTELTNASVLASALMDGIANLANDDHDLEVALGRIAAIAVKAGWNPNGPMLLSDFFHIRLNP